MVTIHSIEEMLNYYVSLGGLRKDAVNGFRYVFPRQHSKVRFWGDLHGFPQRTRTLPIRRIQSSAVSLVSAM